jgi:hypothetical protein
VELRLHIDGKWNAAEFAAFYKCLDELNRYFLGTEDMHLHFGRVYAFAGRYSGYRDSRLDLRVTRVEFASPGFTDIAGLAAIVHEIREFVQFCIEHCASREDRKLARDIKRLEIAKLRLDLLKEFEARRIESPRSLPSGAAELLGLSKMEVPDIDPLLEAVLDGRLTGASEAEPK